MFCPSCGAQLPDEAKFCTSCGFKMEATNVVEEKTEFIGSSQESAPAVEPTPIAKPTPNPIPSPNMPTGDGGNNAMIGKIIFIVIAVLAGIFGIRQGYFALRSLFLLFTNYLAQFYFGLGWFMGILFQLIYLIINVVTAAALLGMAGTNVLSFTKYEKGKGKALFMTGAVLGVVCVVAKVIGFVLNFISSFRLRYYMDVFKSQFVSNIKSTFILIFICVVVVALAYVAFALMGESISFAGGDLVGQCKASVNEVLAMVKGAVPSNMGATTTTTASTMTSATASTGPAMGAPLGGGTTGTPSSLKTNRSLLVYILLGMVTCGIYTLFFIHGVAKDVNTACEGDGQKTSGLLMFIILSIITCGIYSWIWLYKLANRLQINAPRYGFSISENGTSVLLWMLLGCLCFIGSFVAINIVIKNTNAICAGYNNSKGLYGVQ